LGVGLLQGVGFRDIEVALEPSKRPSLMLYREARRLAEHGGLEDWAISVSHERGLAIAFVIASRPPNDRSEPTK